MQQQKHHKKERKDFAFGISFGEFMISLAAGVGGAFVTAANKVTELFDSDQKKATDFRDHYDGISEELWPEELATRKSTAGSYIPPNEARPRGRTERLDAIKLKDFKKPSDYWKKVAAEKADIYEDYLAVSKRVRGVTNRPIIGTFERFFNLSPGSRKALIVPGTIGATIGAAMTLGFFNGIATRDKIERIDEAIQADLNKLISRTTNDQPAHASHTDKLIREDAVKEERPHAQRHAKHTSHTEKLAAADTHHDTAVATR